MSKGFTILLRPAFRLVYNLIVEGGVKKDSERNLKEILEIEEENQFNKLINDVFQKIEQIKLKLY